MFCFLAAKYFDQFTCYPLLSSPLTPTEPPFLLTKSSFHFFFQMAWVLLGGLHEWVWGYWLEGDNSVNRPQMKNDPPLLSILSGLMQPCVQQPCHLKFCWSLCVETSSICYWLLSIRACILSIAVQCQSHYSFVKMAKERNGLKYDEFYVLRISYIADVHKECNIWLEIQFWSQLELCMNISSWES